MLICDLASQVQNFMSQFKLFIIQIDSDFTHFSIWINMPKNLIVIALCELAAKSMRKTEEHFVDMDKFRVNFQVI